MISTTQIFKLATNKEVLKKVAFCYFCYQYPILGTTAKIIYNMYYK